MSLELALEHDIVLFLDTAQAPQPKMKVARQEELALLNRDYFTEIRHLLKRNEIEKAKIAFNDLKTAYAAIPEEHPQEKQRVFEQVQSAYVEIYNHVNEKARTAVLLERYDQTPDDVFNKDTKPVNLQQAQTAVPKIADYEPLTVGELQKRMLSKFAVMENRGSAPPALAVSAQTFAAQPTQSGQTNGPVSQGSAGSAQPGGVQAAQSGQAAVRGEQGSTSFTQPAGRQSGQFGQVGPQSAPTTTTPQVQRPPQVAQIDQTSAIQNLVNVSLKRADSLALSAPSRSLSLLGQTALAMEKLPEDVQRRLRDLLESIEAKAKEQSDINDFKRRFNDEYIKIGSLGRMRSANTTERYTELVKQAETFEKQHPQSAGVFTDKLKTLSETMQINTEDEIADRVKLLIGRIKAARPGTSEQRYAFEMYMRYIESLPAGKYKDILKARLPRQREAKSSEEQVLTLIQPIITRIRFARRRGDRQGLMLALGDLERTIDTLPASPAREALHSRISMLRSDKPQIHSDDSIANAITPYVKRLKAARLKRDKKEERLALAAFTSFVNTLPQAEARKTLEASLFQLRG